MARIVFVHGMRMQDNGTPEALHRSWYGVLMACLRETEWGKMNPHLLPAKSDVDVAYWADLFTRKEPVEPRGEPKGVALDAIRASYHALLRGIVRLADRATFFDDEGRPRGPLSVLVDPLVYQSAVYMHNGPVFHARPDVDDGAFFQVQARFEEKLRKDTRVVIGHSLGSVIAYEGLCRAAHGVHTLITVGSPIATPKLILEPLQERLNRLLNQPADAPLPWPGVRQWLNFYAPADVWCVPVKRLAPVFGESVRDIEVVHGSPHDFVATHRLTTYFREHPLEFGNEIARVLQDLPPRDPAMQSAGPGN